MTHGFGAHMVSFIEGFGNAVSFGLTTKFDNWVSPGSSCTYAHDGWYTAGDVTGQVVLAVVTDGGSAEEEAALDAARGAESVATHEAEATAEREAENAAERAGAKAADRGPSCGGESFTAATAVVMADGSTKALDRIKVGDKVRAVDPKTGKASVRTVSRVWVNHDTDLMDVTVRSGGRDSVIHATQRHLFWDASRKEWVEAQSLRVGERLTDDDGRIVTVVRALVVPGAMDMWDLTVDQDHDFFVVTETTTVLVHNCDDPELPSEHSHHATKDEAYQAALQDHDLTDPSLVERQQIYGRNPNMLGPNGEPWEKVGGLDSHGNWRQFELHPPHLFEDTGTGFGPHFKGETGHHYFWDEP